MAQHGHTQTCPSLPGLSPAGWEGPAVGKLRNLPVSPVTASVLLTLPKPHNFPTLANSHSGPRMKGTGVVVPGATGSPTPPAHSGP